MKYITLLSLLILFGTASAQVKIGTLTVPDSVAKEYFLDLYAHPDTFKVERYIVWQGEGKGVERSNIPEGGKGIFDTVFYSDVRSSEWNRNHEAARKASEIKGIDHIPAGFYIANERYLLPRKATQEDFIKWYTKH